jgi:hypothetical protein
MDRMTAVELTGGLSHPSKMPGYAIGIPASECKVGGKLAAIPGSVCFDCYALKGMYQFPVVQAAQHRRLDALGSPHWVEAMTYLIVSTAKFEWQADSSAPRAYFRWHDSGDLQDMSHLLAIVEVCENTPEISHWLPTREKALVLSYLRQFGAFPANLTVRLSAAMVDGDAPAVPAGLNTSTVHAETPAIDHDCPARHQGNSCGNCRACWARAVQNVGYPQH